MAGNVSAGIEGELIMRVMGHRYDVLDVVAHEFETTDRAREHRMVEFLDEPVPRSPFEGAGDTDPASCRYPVGLPAAGRGRAARTPGGSGGADTR